MIKPELRLFLSAMIYPLLFIAILWMILIVDLNSDLNLTQYGLKPLRVDGLIGILTAPLLHSDIKHLISNSIPLFVLGTGLFYYYRDCAFKVFIMSYIITGFWTWFMGRGYAIHIGASGVVNALITFHLLSAIIRKRRDLEAYSLIVILLYGSFVWGFFPDFYPDRDISWQSHLSGAIAGIVIALFYRDQGPQKIVWEWPEEDDDDDTEKNYS